MKRFLSICALILLLTTQSIAAPGTLQNDTRSTWFSCHMVSTATTLAMITGCDVVTGSKYYITSVVVASSVISTSSNYFILSSGTGTNCGTTNTARYGAMSLAFTTVSQDFPVPIISAASEMLCFIHAAAGTKDITITGYLAP